MTDGLSGGPLKTGIESRQVSWFETLTYAARFATENGIELLHAGLPLPGTPRWCGLPDDDARKLLALLLGGVREALAHDIEQEHRADASRAIAHIAVTTELGPRRRERGSSYIPRKAC